ncbi:TetR/AcrR family transcriptional regulator [Streptomyces sp. MJM1172]|uniref:TetR/AcrR family transcriptional regulator n=1 Tax=Streptomyces sp. MJM1172 TaxID=1703926 RepID=UPI0009A14498|nr:TetR/AcrR family transcriptional regulator [Streptomyces sp. MJM1172]
MRTRIALIRAAASEFDTAGYDGTSLSRISGAAGMSIGAVTFHFPSKTELADAVQEEGRAVTEAALSSRSAENLPALRMVVDLTLELARLMDEEPAVRAAIRLSRERPGTGSWSDVWLPAVRELLDRAYETGQLRENALPADVTTLVEYLTSGAEAYMRSRIGTEAEFESAVAQLKRVWHLALAGVSADGSPGATPLPGPRGTRDS